MRDARAGPGWKSWRVLLEAGSVAGLADATLLGRFLAGRDDVAEVAFAALVARHGPMVRRVCRGLLVDPNDADDAFQATFLVLARRAGAIDRPDRLSSWLYGTAHRVSRKLKVQSARRRRHEAGASREEPSLVADPGRSEGAEAVLEEVARLPESYKAAVVLCELEGRTQPEAARLLGLSERTVRRHLIRARSLLRARLTRRGLAPTAAALASALAPGSSSASVPGGIVDATARAATRYASGVSTAGVVPASALILAEGVIEAMTWTEWKWIATVAGSLLALGGGIGVASGFLAHAADEPAKSNPKPEARAVAADPRPADRYRALVKKHDDALKVYQAATLKATTEAERTEVYKLSPSPRDHSPAFVALAEEFPRDPVAVDALLWAAEKGLSAVYSPQHPGGRAFARALEILARDHADEPRIGAYCGPTLTWCPDPIKGVFLRAIAGRSRDRVVKGRATLTLAEYLRSEAALAELFQCPDAPVNFDALIPLDTPDDIRRQMTADPAAYRRQIETFQARFQPDYLESLKRADVAALRRESDQAFDRVVADFADVPGVPPHGKPTRETLADLVRRYREPRPSLPPVARFKAQAEAFRAAEKKANEAAETAGRGEAGVKAYIAAAPKWADFGPKMWAIAEAAPRSPDALDALLWILRHHMPMFDAREERAAMVGRAVDVLIRDHLDFIGDNLAARNVAEAFNNGSPMPAPHFDRLYRALYERGRTREIRGRMGLALARHFKGLADLAESLDVRGTDPERRPEILMWDPAFLDRIRRERPELDGEAGAILERVKADYGDVNYVNGTVPTEETLAVVADRELADLRTLAVGQPAPEITGEDVDGKPMALSEFRGKVVLLDFGSHEHCGGCRLVYPRLRTIVDQHRGRPLVVLGVNNNDRRDILEQLKAKGEVTWRCWRDGDREDGPGPITTRWNIRGYPTFIVLDHRGVIRFKDLHPDDVRGFDEAIEPLVKQAEMEAARR